MAKYRNKLQIISEILEIVRDGAKKTHIMYRANLSYRLLCKYLDEVLERGLIRIDGGDSYVVAPKGERFLRRFYSYVKRRDHVKKELKQVVREKTLLEQMYTGAKAGNLGKKNPTTKRKREGA